MYSICSHAHTKTFCEHQYNLITVNIRRNMQMKNIFLFSFEFTLHEHRFGLKWNHVNDSLQESIVPQVMNMNEKVDEKDVPDSLVIRNAAFFFSVVIMKTHTKSIQKESKNAENLIRHLMNDE